MKRKQKLTVEDVVIAALDNGGEAITAPDKEAAEAFVETTEDHRVNRVFRRCINCGEKRWIVLRADDKRFCEKCSHTWDESAEASPYVQTQRG